MLSSWIVVISFVWLGQAFALSWVMSRRGFHPLPWLVVGLLLGPGMWPLALLEAIWGPSRPEVVRPGRLRRFGVDVLVVFEENDLPEALARQVERLIPHSRRLVFGRIIKAGGPDVIKQEAEVFLERIAYRLGADEAELQILYGEMRKTVHAVHERGEFGVVLRSDHPDEHYDGGGQPQEVRCLRDVPAA